MSKVLYSSGDNKYVLTTNKLIEPSSNQLSAPEDLEVENTTASWEVVDNATSYDLYADGVKIGEFICQKPFADSVFLYNTSASQSGTEVSI